MAVPCDFTALFSNTRALTENICSPLEPDDFVAKPAEDVFPPKWYLGHTTRFFEEAVLKRLTKAYQPVSGPYKEVFASPNSSLSRPILSEVLQYREQVPQAVLEFLQKTPFSAEEKDIIETACHYGKQYQEILLRDITFIFGTNLLFPAYDDYFSEHEIQAFPTRWLQPDPDDISGDDLPPALRDFTRPYPPSICQLLCKKRTNPFTGTRLVEKDNEPD